MKRQQSRNGRVSEVQAYASGRAGSREKGKTVTRSGAKAALMTPSYDRERGELRIGQMVVKHFTQESDAQATILLAFEEENWPAFMDDPLPGKDEQDPKQRLRTAVANLNRRQRVPLLRFRVRRQGTAVAWEFRDESDSRAT